MDSLPSRIDLEAEKQRRKFSEFVKASWHILCPSTPLVHHFAVDAICEHLQAVSARQIDRLIINVPPGMAKSSLVAVLWPCWEWATAPQIQWLFATYRTNLTFRDADKRRDLIKSEWYQERFGRKFQITGEGIEYLKNSAKGFMYSTSTGGETTGWRGDRLILDDPQDPKGAESDIKRESTIEWLTRTWPSRMNLNSQHKGRVLIQQRLHEMDATGLYLRNGGWEHLKIPLEYTGKTYSTSIGWKDPRTKLNEVISEEIYPKKDREQLKRDLGPYGISGQLQQEPAPMEGGLIKRDWIRHYEDDNGKLVIRDAKGDIEYVIDPWSTVRFCTVDPAITEKDLESQIDPDYTCMASWAVFHSTRGVMVFLLDLIRQRMEGPEIIARMKAFHAHWKFAVIGVETIAFQKMIAQYAKREGLPIREIGQKEDSIYRIDKDKTSRALSATPLMADGRFYVPLYAPWLGDYINELILFPNAAHDDQVDVTAYGVAIAQKLKAWQTTSDNGTGYKPPRRNYEDEQREENPMDGMRVANPYEGI